MLTSLSTKLAEIREDKAENDRGFTLIELLVVVVIIGILIAIAIPLYLNYQKGAKDKSAQSDLRAAVAAVNQCYTDAGNTYPLTSAVSGNGTASTNLGFTCGTSTTETANVSSGTTLTYTPYSTVPATNATSGTACTTAGTCVSFALTASNSGGNGTTYHYYSWAGGSIQ